MSPTSQVDTPRIGARVLLLDQHDRVLLMHARDPDDPGHHWWELPGGGLDDGESLAQAAVREVAEETGIELDKLGPQVWVRESRFRYRNRDHHRIDHVFLARQAGTTATVATKPTENEKLGLIDRAWFTTAELHACTDKLLPASLPTLLEAIVTGDVPDEPIVLHD
jgi:ADP-ribose pyrophosphatase YjhB (NUDIX family)